MKRSNFHQEILEAHIVRGLFHPSLLCPFVKYSDSLRAKLLVIFWLISMPEGLW